MANSRSLIALLLATLAGAPQALGQAIPAGPAWTGAGDVAGTALLLRRIDGVKRVLMIGAHPDDEDTALLARLALGDGARVAYLSLTRGEGGQNLIGGELREGLGLVRTGELLAAREIDGAEQYFTRAFDFGYSKSLEESLEQWPLDKVLRDVVYVLRSFRPQVVVSLFSGTPRDGHGQHQYAGFVAKRAFEAAGDPARFPELARVGVLPWTPQKLYFRSRSAGSGALAVATGELDPLLGRSHYQAAMDARSRHRSQDMGAAQSPGPRFSRIVLDSGPSPSDAEDDGIFAGVDTTFVGAILPSLPPRQKARGAELLQTYRSAVQRARSRLSVSSPSGAAPALLTASAALREVANALPKGAARDLAHERLAMLHEAVFGAAGVIIDARISADLLIPGDSVVLDVIAWNGGPFFARGRRPELALPDGWTSSPTERSVPAPSRSSFFARPPVRAASDAPLAPGGIARWSFLVSIPKDANLSAPYFLRAPMDGSLYRWPDDGGDWAMPGGPPPVRAQMTLQLSASAEGAPFGDSARVSVDARRVRVDKAFGELSSSPLVVPPLSIRLSPTVMAWPVGDASPRTITASIANLSSEEQSGTLRLEAPQGWSVLRQEIGFSLPPMGSSRALAFEVQPPASVSSGRVSFRAFALLSEDSGTRHDRAVRMIDYPHIPRSMLIEPARAEVSVFPLAVDASIKVGYVMGSGDEGPQALSQIGLSVETIDDEALREGDFSSYDVVILGIRAFETRPLLASANASLLAFARGGGTVISQYNKYEYPQGGFAPYPVGMRRPHDRVTDEGARVGILDPSSPLWTGPNRIDESDFDGWVQERGLYFLSEWDERFTPQIEMADPGEAPLRGGLLVAPVGDGLYVYTGLSFFRQLPAGVPGAYRILANLVSLKGRPRLP